MTTRLELLRQWRVWLNGLVSAAWNTLWSAAGTVFVDSTAHLDLTPRQMTFIILGLVAVGLINHFRQSPIPDIFVVEGE